MNSSVLMILAFISSLVLCCFMLRYTSSSSSSERSRAYFELYAASSEKGYHPIFRAAFAQAIGEHTEFHAERSACTTQSRILAIKAGLVRGGQSLSSFCKLTAKTLFNGAAKQTSNICFILVM